MTATAAPIIPAPRDGGEACKHDLTAAWCAICTPRFRAPELTIGDWERANPEADTADLASSYVGRLDEDEVRDLCGRLLAGHLNDRRRARVRAIEKRAYEERSTRAIRDHAKELDREHRAQTRMARRNSGEAFPDAGASMRECLAQFHEETRAEVLLELTEEFLTASFALGDGSAVTWGEATVEQHKRRFDMLMGQAQGSMNTAQRHMAAVVLIERAGADTLYEAERRTRQTNAVRP